MAFGENQIDGYAEGEEPLVFYHRRGSFRENEPEHLRNLAEGKAMPKRGFLRVLVNSKGNRMIFVVMVLCFVFLGGYKIFARGANEGSVGGINCKLSAFSFQDAVYASLSLKQSAADKKKDSLPSQQPLTVLFAAVTEDGTELARWQEDALFLKGEGGEQFVRATFEVGAARILCVVQADEGTAELSTAVERK
mgnify:CR=1 FL=1